jgi:hypothetical protein
MKHLTIVTIASLINSSHITIMNIIKLNWTTSEYFASVSLAYLLINTKESLLAALYGFFRGSSNTLAGLCASCSSSSSSLTSPPYTFPLLYRLSSSNSIFLIDRFILIFILIEKYLSVLLEFVVCSYME